MSDTEEKRILTWTRIRAKGEPEFYDPNTDLLKLFPCAADIAIRYLQDVYKDDQQMLDELNYLFRCFKVLQIRVAEDKTPVSQQFDEFNQAIAKAGTKAVNLWRATLFRIQTCIYTFMCRRYAAMDKAELTRLTNTIQISLLKDVLSKETYDKVVNEMHESHKLLEDSANVAACGLIVCDETGDIIDNAKEVVSVLLANPEANAGWNEVADACDEEFSTAGGTLTDQQAVCMALAYPSYKHSDLKVTQEEDGQTGR